MSKSKKTTAHTPHTPASFAAKVLTKHLSNDQLYWEILDQLSADDFQELENAVITANPGMSAAVVAQEVGFMLGLEIGRRLGGAR